MFYQFSLFRALLDATELCDMHEIRVVDLNIADLNFCYSACVKVFTEWMTCQFPRPSRIIVGIGKPFWQKTSMKALVGMSPNCTINDLTQVVVNPPMVVTTADIPESDCPETTTSAPMSLACAHVNRHSEEEHFFAPTGSGSIVTIVKCKDCGVELHRSSEYFD